VLQSSRDKRLKTSYFLRNTVILKCTEIYFLRKPSLQQHTYTDNGTNKFVSWSKIFRNGLNFRHKVSKSRSICGLVFEKLVFITSVAWRLHATLRLLEGFRTGLFLGEVDNISLTSHYVSRFKKATKLVTYTAEQIDTKMYSFPALSTTIINSNTSRIWNIPS
jgi:hypothetical protein